MEITILNKNETKKLVVITLRCATEHVWAIREHWTKSSTMIPKLQTNSVLGYFFRGGPGFLSREMPFMETESHNEMRPPFSGKDLGEFLSEILLFKGVLGEEVEEST